MVELEIDFRNIAFEIIMEFENQIKKDVLTFLDEKKIKRDFWMDEKNFTKKYINKSKYKLFITKVLKNFQNYKKVKLAKGWWKYDLKTKKNIIVTVAHDFDIIMYYISLGSFFDLLSGVSPKILRDFCDKKIKTTHKRYESHSFLRY